MKNKKWLWVVIILAVVLVGWIGIRWWNRDVVAIKTAKVSRGTIEAIVSATGIVDAPVYELGSRTGGKVLSLLVKEGQRVRNGTTILEFDDLTGIVAPSNGVVAKINYIEGETAPPGSPAIVLVNYEKSWVEAQIDEIDFSSVKVRDKVKISSDVYPDKIFDGEIYWIAPLAELRKVGGRVKMDEESYVFPCKIKFLGEHSNLLANMSVNVDISTKINENTLVVPREALISQNEHTNVFVIKRNRAYQNKIDIGIRSWSSVEALSGVSENDLVAVSNIIKLKDKGRVRIEQ